MRLKPAFTFAEVLLVMLIIAIVSLAALHYLKPPQQIESKAVKTMYKTVYTTLNTVAYDLVYRDDTNPFELSEDEQTRGVTQFGKLCSGFADYINIIENHCDQGALDNNVGIMTNEETDFSNIEPHLVTATGVRLYFSGLMEGNALEQDIQYYMIYADFNHNNFDRPHTIQYQPDSERLPYVYAFAMVPPGHVIPMGLAEYSTSVLEARVGYRIDRDSMGFSNVSSYRKAKHKAWGCYSAGNAIPEFRRNIAITYNDYIRNHLVANGSQLYNFLNGANFPAAYNDGIINQCQAVAPRTVYDMCKIYVDSRH